MASTNPDSITPAQGEIHPKVPRDEPLTTKGHAPGVKVGNDAVSEFHTETLPAGTAPSDKTFQPNPTNETPGQANNPDMTTDTATLASSTIGGATSGDVHQGLGLPGQEQNGAQSHGDVNTKK